MRRRHRGRSRLVRLMGQQSRKPPTLLSLRVKTSPEVANLLCPLSCERFNTPKPLTCHLKFKLQG